MSNQKTKSFLRSLSLLLVVSFLFEQVSFGAEEIKAFSPISKPSGFSLGFDLPESIATLEDHYQAPVIPAKAGIQERPFVYLLQDAHTNTSGQLNLSKTLDLILSHHSESMPIFLEGGLGDQSLSFLRPFKSLSERKQIASQYLHQGILHGPEYLDLTSNHPFTLWGVEDAPLYLESLEKYKTVAKQRPKYQDYLQRIEQTVKILKSRIYNPLLLSLDESHTQHQRGNITITQYLKKLTTNQDLKNYPHLKSLKKLRRLEQVLERQKKHYPKLSVINHYKKLSSNLQAKTILKELEDLEQKAFDSLLITEDERQLFEASKTLDYFKKLLNLTLTPEEFKEHPSLTSLTGFLNKKIMDLKAFYENALFLEEGFDDVLKASEEFYNLTLKRDEAFIENMVKVWADQPAVLITGGYHTPNLKKLLKEQNISYIVLTPTITHETNQKRYEQILLNQKSSPPSLNQNNPQAFTAPKVTTLANAYSSLLNGFEGTWPILSKRFNDPAVTEEFEERKKPTVSPDDFIRLKEEPKIEIVGQGARLATHQQIQHNALSRDLPALLHNINELKRKNGMEGEKGVELVAGELIDILQNDPKTNLETVAWALSLLGPEIVTFLREMLKEKKRFRRRLAILALGQLGPNAKDVLKDLESRFELFAPYNEYNSHHDNQELYLLSQAIGKIDPNKLTKLLVSYEYDFSPDHSERSKGDPLASDVEKSLLFRIGPVAIPAVLEMVGGSMKSPSSNSYLEENRSYPIGEECVDLRTYFRHYQLLTEILDQFFSKNKHSETVSVLVDAIRDFSSLPADSPNTSEGHFYKLDIAIGIAKLFINHFPGVIKKEREVFRNFISFINEKIFYNTNFPDSKERFYKQEIRGFVGKLSRIMGKIENKKQAPSNQPLEVKSPGISIEKLTQETHHYHFRVSSKPITIDRLRPGTKLLIKKDGTEARVTKVIKNYYLDIELVSGKVVQRTIDDIQDKIREGQIEILDKDGARLASGSPILTFLGVGIFGFFSFVGCAVAKDVVMKEKELPSKKIIPALIAPTSIPVLMRALKNENKEARLRAVYAFIEEGKKAIPSLIKDLKSEDPEVRSSAVKIFEDVARLFRETVLVLTEFLEHRDPAIRLRITDGLIEIGGEVVSALTKILKDEDPETRFRIIQIFKHTIKPATKDIEKFRSVFTENWKNDVSFPNKFLIFITLISGMSQSTREVLDEIFKSGARLAKEELGEAGQKIEKIIQDLEDSISKGQPNQMSLDSFLALASKAREVSFSTDDEARKRALAILEYIQSSGEERISRKIIHDLELLSEHASTPIAVKAALSLVYLKFDEDLGTKALQTLYATNFSEVKSWKKEIALGVIFALKNSFVPEFRNEASTVLNRVLSGLGPETQREMVATLIQMLEDTQCQKYAVAALGKIGYEARPAVPRLIEIIQNQKYQFAEERLAAVKALGEMGPPAKGAVPSLEAVKNDKTGKTWAQKYEEQYQKNYGYDLSLPKEYSESAALLESSAKEAIEKINKNDGARLAEEWDPQTVRERNRKFIKFLSHLRTYFYENKKLHQKEELKTKNDRKFIAILKSWGIAFASWYLLSFSTGVFVYLLFYFPSLFFPFIGKLINFSFFAIGLSSWFFVSVVFRLILAFLSFGAVRKSSMDYGEKSAFFSQLERLGISKEQLYDWMLNAKNLESLFDLLNQKGLLLIKPSFYDQRIFGVFAFNIWKTVRREALPHPPSEFGESVGILSHKVQVGRRVFHVIGVRHGVAELIPSMDQKRVLTIVSDLEKKATPLYSEQNFKSGFGYSYGNEINDHIIGGDDHLIYFGMLLLLTPITALALTFLFVSRKIYLKGKIKYSEGPPDYLRTHFFRFRERLVKMINRRERSLMMAEEAFNDKSGSSEVTILLGLGHLYEVVDELRRFSQELAKLSHWDKQDPVIIRDYISRSLEGGRAYEEAVPNLVNYLEKGGFSREDIARALLMIGIRMSSESLENLIEFSRSWKLLMHKKIQGVGRRVESLKKKHIERAESLKKYLKNTSLSGNDALLLEILGSSPAKELGSLAKEFEEMKNCVSDPLVKDRIQKAINKIAGARLVLKWDMTNQEIGGWSRREFLKFAGVAGFSMMLPGKLWADGKADQKKIAQFLKKNVTTDGLPLSFRASRGYWKKLLEEDLEYQKFNRERPVDAVLERLLVGEEGFAEAGSLNLYDGALWQIALAINGQTNLADTHTKRLLSGRSGKLEDIRAFKEPFKYGDEDKAFPKNQAFFFRNIADVYEMTDPLDGKTSLNGFPNWPRLHHEDWRPVAGENAWAGIIGPLQVAHQKYGKKIPVDSDELKLALSIFPAIEAMQSPIGAIYYAPKGTLTGRSEGEISTENNLSVLAALRMLGDVTGKTDRDISSRIQKVAGGIESYLKDHAFDADRGIFLQGGFYQDGKFTSNPVFSVDAQTWALIVLGPAWINEVLGHKDPSMAYRFWKKMNQVDGYLDRNGRAGFSFSNTHDVLSLEWTAGGILAAKETAHYYELLYEATKDVQYQSFAQELWKDAEVMTQTLESFKIHLSDGSIAYPYANKRYEVPFGWWANPIPSVASSAWIFMVNRSSPRKYFNPFILGGGLHFDKKGARLAGKIEELSTEDKGRFYYGGGRYNLTTQYKLKRILLEPAEGGSFEVFLASEPGKIIARYDGSAKRFILLFEQKRKADVSGRVSFRGKKISLGAAYSNQEIIFVFTGEADVYRVMSRGENLGTYNANKEKFSPQNLDLTRMEEKNGYLNVTNHGARLVRKNSEAEEDMGVFGVNGYSFKIKLENGRPVLVDPQTGRLHQGIDLYEERPKDADLETRSTSRVYRINSNKSGKDDTLPHPKFSGLLLVKDWGEDRWLLVNPSYKTDKKIINLEAFKSRDWIMLEEKNGYLVLVTGSRLAHKEKPFEVDELDLNDFELTQWSWAKDFEKLNRLEAGVFYAMGTGDVEVFFKEPRKKLLTQEDVERFFEMMDWQGSQEGIRGLFDVYRNKGFIPERKKVLSSSESEEHRRKSREWIKAFHSLENKVLYAKGLEPLVALDEVSKTDEQNYHVYKIPSEDIHRLYLGSKGLYEEDHPIFKFSENSLTAVDRNGRLLSLDIPMGQGKLVTPKPENPALEPLMPFLTKERLLIKPADPSSIVIQDLGFKKPVFVSRIIKPKKVLESGARLSDIENKKDDRAAQSRALILKPILDQSELMDNHYEALGIEKDASLEDIKEAFRNSHRKYSNKANQGDKDAEALLKKANLAYSVLSDPEKKKRYDELLFLVDPLIGLQSERRALLKYFDGQEKHGGAFSSGAMGSMKTFSETVKQINLLESEITAKNLIELKNPSSGEAELDLDKKDEDRAQKVDEVFQPTFDMFQIGTEEDTEVFSVTYLFEEEFKKFNPDTREALNFLIKSLDHKIPEVRLSAILYIRKMGFKAGKAIPHLIKALGDSSSDVSSESAQALAVIGRKAIPRLIRVLGGKDPNLKFGAIDTFAYMGPLAKEAVPALIKILKPDVYYLSSRASDALTAHAADALGQMGLEASSAIPELIKTLGNPSPEVRASVARALGEMGIEAKPAIPSLVAALGDSNIDLAQAAQKAIDKINSGARLALQSAVEVENRLSEEDIPTALSMEDAQQLIGAPSFDPTVTFLAIIYEKVTPKKAERKVAVDQTVFEIKEEKGELVISGYGKELLRTKKYQKVARQGDTHEVTVSTTDWQIAIKRANQVIEEMTPISSLDQKKAVSVINLNAFYADPISFQTVNAPDLAWQMKLAHNRSWGGHGKFVLQGGAWLVAQVLSEVQRLYPQGQDFIFEREKDLPQDYQTAPRSLITAPGQKTVRGMRHVFTQLVETGTLTNTAALFKESFEVARVEKLETADRGFMQVRDHYQILLGFSVDPAELIRATKAEDPRLAEKHAFRPIACFPLNKLAQGARLVSQMVSQSV